MVPFASYSFIVRESGLESLDLPLDIPLKTWNAHEIVLPVNFSKQSTYQKKYQNTIQNAMQDLNDILLQSVRLELEIRQSDFIVMASKNNYLQASTISIKFDRASVVDSMMAQDLSERAEFYIQMISEDSRSIRQKKRFKLNKFDFDTSIHLTMF
jgi:hypothetical protein